MKRWAAPAVLMLLAVGCGTPDSSFPPEAECTPLALPTSSSVAGVTSPGAFLDAARDTALELQRLRNDFVAEYPDDTFYRRSSFRPDMGAFANATICAAQALRDIESPVAGLDAYTSTLHNALDELIAHTRFGRQAVQSRNVSEYRQYRRTLDTRLAAVTAIAFSQR